MRNCPHSLFRGCSESQILSSLFSTPQGWLVPNLHLPDPKPSSSPPSLRQHSSPSLFGDTRSSTALFSPSVFISSSALPSSRLQAHRVQSPALLSCFPARAKPSHMPKAWLETSARPLRLWLYPVLLAYTNALRSLS